MAENVFTHPDLSRPRLKYLGMLMLLVWQGALHDHRPKRGDGRCTLGVRFFERLIMRLTQASLRRPWLRIVEDTTHFVVSVGEVPLRFYKGEFGVLKQNYRYRREDEETKHQIAFPFLKEETCIRVVLEERAVMEEAAPSQAGAVALVGRRRTARVALVHYSLDTNRAISVLDLRTMKPIALETPLVLPLGGTATPSSGSDVVRPLLPPPVEVPKAKPRSRKRPPVQGTGSDDTP